MKGKLCLTATQVHYFNTQLILKVICNNSRVTVAHTIAPQPQVQTIAEVILCFLVSRRFRINGTIKGLSRPGNS